MKKGSCERESEKLIFLYAGMEPRFEASKQQLAVDIAWSRKQTPVECLSILNTLLLQATRTGSVVKKAILSSCILDSIKDQQKFCALKFHDIKAQPQEK